MAEVSRLRGVSQNSKMVSTLIGFTVVGIVCIIMLVVAFYPQFRSKRSNVNVSARVRPKPLLFDSRYGLCRIESGEPLPDNAMKLELFSENGQTYYTKYYDDEIQVYNKFNNLVGSGSPMYITKTDYNIMEGRPTTEISEQSKLKNELIEAKAKAKIVANNPDDVVDKVVNWLTQIEGTKRVKEVRV